MNPLIHIAGWTLVHFAWQGTVIALLAAAALRLLTRARAQARYIVACVSLVAMLASIVVTVRLLSGSEDLPAKAGSHTLLELRAKAERYTLSGSLSVASGFSRPLSVAFGFSRKITMPHTDTVLLAIVTIWLAGVSTLLIRLAGGWWRVRQMHRTSLAMAASRWQMASERMANRLSLNRAIHVVDSSLVHAPTVVGWLRPVIFLPVAALANLTPAQVDAILAHELAHIRRHDFIVNVLQTIAETLLFYHPGVWWLSSRIRAEREHCCDEVAVEVCGDAVAYAAALAELETWRAGYSTFALAATGGSLLDRVKRVLGAADTSRTPSISMTTALVVALIVVAGALQYVFARQPSQSQVESRAGSDARPVQKDRPYSDGGTVAWRMLFDHPSGQLTFGGFTGRDLIRFAYQLPESRVLGGPNWIDTETFDLSTSLDHVPAADEMPDLVRQFLEERFDLSAHEETRRFPVYALVVARPDGALGPNLQPATSDCFDQQAWIASGRPRLEQLRTRRLPFCGVWDENWSGAKAERVTIAQLAEYLSRQHPVFNRPVVDRTRLSGTFDVTIDIFPPAAAVMGLNVAARTVLEPIGLKSFPTALEEQLGLRLVDTTAPGNVLVIDRVERPLTN